MQRVFSALLFWTLIPCACSPGMPSPEVVPATNTAVVVLLPATPVPTEPQNCGYQWASQDLPQLSSSFQKSIQELQPEAQASAYAFGEDCVLPDGSIADFLARETDFHVMVHVDDLANESVLGRWIVQIMQVIDHIPAEQVAGLRPGKVSVVFQSSTAQDIVNFHINQYKELPPRFNYAEIYEALKALQ